MKQLCLLFLVLLTPFAMYAWDAPGHEIGGAIAYYYLKANKPSAIPEILETLSYHPWYKKNWDENLFGLKDEEREITIFMLAAEYPDEIKKFKVLDDKEKRPWHSVNYPFEPAGSTIPTKQPTSPNAQDKLLELLGKIKGEKDSEQKAIDLCWIFHLIGEIHDPLNTISFFDINHKEGDNGGAETYIILKRGATPVSLRDYWENIPEGTLPNIRTIARDLMQKYAEASLTELTTNKDVASWIKNESFPIAEKDLYLDGKVNGMKATPTLVDAAYTDKGKDIAYRRVTLSGIRLGKELMEIYNK